MAEQPPPQQPPPVAPPTLWEDVAAMQDLQESQRVLLGNVRKLTPAERIEFLLEGYEFDTGVIAGLLLTTINGDIELPEQKVEVEYLKADQRLIIPGGLAMSPVTQVPTIIAPVAALVNRYLRFANMRYVDMKALTGTKTPYAQVRARIEALPMAQLTALKTDWDTRLADGTADEQSKVSIVYAYMSQAMQMNFDVRDMGALTRDDMRLADGAWRTIADTPKSRLHNKIRPWTLQNLAGLNLEPCANYELGAWTRAYGVGCGFLPDVNSLSVCEYKFSTTFPAVTRLRSIVEFERKQETPLLPLCLNIIAMFGLFHLNKDHTFRTNDANMERVGTSFIQTLRTMVKPDMLEQLLANKEVVVRTAAHPFALGQTYWVAQMMGKYGLLANPLAIRLDVTPPTVQRIMIANAVRSEWATLPAGQMINGIYQDIIDIIISAVAQVKVCPPAFSSLHTLYGIPQPIALPPNTMSAANAIMPIILGFAEAVHTEEGIKRDGVALALSLNNVRRDNRSISQVWTNMWRSYMESMDSGGIMQFAMDARKSWSIPAAPEQAAPV